VNVSAKQDIEMGEKYLDEHNRDNLRGDFRSSGAVSVVDHVACDGLGQSKCRCHGTEVADEEETPGSAKGATRRSFACTQTHDASQKTYAGKGAGGAPEYQMPKIRSFDAAATRFTLVVVRSFGYLCNKMKLGSVELHELLGWHSQRAGFTFFAD
jgi:hypothetical protein